MEQTVKALPAIELPHVKVTRGPFGWTAVIKGGSGVILGYGFTESGILGEAFARADALRKAIAQV